MTQARWLRRRSAEPGFDWSFIAYWTLVGLFVTYSLYVFAFYVGHYIERPNHLFSDAPLYYRATEAWLAGANPWQVSSDIAVPFAGPPPTLLVNLPLQPFGEGSAYLFWPIAGTAGWLFTLRRLGLPPWWLLFPPFVEAILAGSPDPALVGLATMGGGAIAVVGKAYAAPAVLAERDWRSLVIAGVLILATAPLLPWGMFLDELGTIRTAFATYSINGSAWGEPALMLATAMALLALGWRVGLLMATPGLWPGAQLHYSLFSARAGLVSPFLGLTLAIPHAAPYGIIAFAMYMRLSPHLSARLRSKIAGPRSVS